VYHIVLVVYHVVLYGSEALSKKHTKLARFSALLSSGRTLGFSNGMMNVIYRDIMVNVIYRDIILNKYRSRII
jgi:hypothetical protein